MVFFKNVKKENYFLSQPHQPFFILGVINAILFMGIFALDYRSLISLHVSVAFFHVYSLIFLVFTNFFIGFLFTTFPRFNQSQVVSKSYYLRVFLANLVGTTLFLLGAIASKDLVIVALIILLISHSFVVVKLRYMYKTGQSANKKDSFWILAAQYFGLFSEILYISYLFGFSHQNIAINISFYLYLIFLVFSVAQRMIPFFSHSIATKNTKFTGVVFVLFIFQTLFSEYNYLGFVKIFEAVLDYGMGIYILREFLRWKLPIFSSAAILWVLYLGLFWLPTALFISSFTLILELIFKIDFYFLSIHLISLGFLTTIFIGFGTRVILGHSGHPPQADKFARNIFLSIELILFFRVLYSISVAFGRGLPIFFDMAIASWLLLFIAWGCRYGKFLMYD